MRSGHVQKVLISVVGQRFPSGGAISGPTGEVQAQTTTRSVRESINQVREYIRELKEDNDLGQVTSVSEFVDVKQPEWAFLALQ